MSKHANTHRKLRANLPRRSRALALGSATALLASVGVALTALPAQAAVTLAVSTTGSDANSCFVGSPCKTIQKAVNTAGLFSTAQDVLINVGAGTFTESSSDATAGLLINGASVPPLSVTIVGAGADKTTVSPTAGRRVIKIAAAYPVTLKGLTIAGGAPSAPATAGQPGQSGGGILKTNLGGNLTLTDVVLRDNAAGSGSTGATGPNGPNGTSSTEDGGGGTAGGPGGAGGLGGAIAFLGSGTLTVEGSTITNNRAGHGGTGGAGGKGGNGYNQYGPDGNGGTGAVGGAGGPAGSGGAIAFGGSTLTVKNSTIVINATGRGGNGGAGGAGGNGGSGSSQGAGGAGAVGGAAGAGGSGGGIAVLANNPTAAPAASLTHVTLASNAPNGGGTPGTGGAGGSGATTGTSAGNGAAGLFDVSGGLYRAAGTITVANSILNNQPANCAATTGITPTNTVAGDNSCFAVGPGLIVNTAAANLQPLALNGGTTPTSIPTSGNPALGLVPAGNCLSTDQRGQTRPGLSGPSTCAAGAYEPQVPPVAPTITGVISAAHPKTTYGWYRDTVTVTFTCTPGSSPYTAAGCPAPMVIATQGANQGGTVTVTNQQGLNSSIKVALNIDKGLPNLTIKGVKKGQLYNKAKKVTCLATDSLSGPYVCQVTATGKLVKGNTQVRVNYKATAVDKAGNTRTKTGHYFFKRSA